MPVFFINLDRSAGRRAEMHRRLTCLGLDYERISAIDGLRLPDDVQRRWCPAPGLSYHLGPGEIGCFLSHRECWKRVLQRAKPFAVILEDDIDLAPAARALFASSEWIPPDADIVKIETRLKGSTLVDRDEIFADGMHSATRLRGRHTGSAGYIVARRAAEKLLTMTDTFADAIDQFLFNPDLAAFHTLVTYQLVPAVCIQEKWIRQRNEGGKALPSELDVERSRLRPKSSLWQKGQKAVAHAVTAWINGDAPRPPGNSHRRQIPFG
jgi:glycosyl transferase family 25